jgi:cytochrome P450
VLRGHAPSLDDVPNLPYTGHVITESMRLYPPAWGMARIAIEDTEIAGYPIPKGCGVSLAQWVVHRDPRWFDAPMEFRPERWEGDLLKRLPRFAYFPFGGGPRQCIGNNFAVMEAVLLLATIAQKFRIRLASGKSIVPAASITLRPKTGIWGKIEAR